MPSCAVCGQQFSDDIRFLNHMMEKHGYGWLHRIDGLIVIAILAPNMAMSLLKIHEISRSL